MDTKNETPINPRTYMELAVEEMKKSLNEPRVDGKIPPKVGVILLFPDGQVVRAHRGELRDGDHAEFTLLERKLGHKKLDECILFTTLEPCVRRNSPKVGCSKRTAKSRIKKVYVGVQDPDPSVAGEGIRYLESRSVKVTMFDKELQKSIEMENSDFLEQALNRAIEAKVEQKQLKDVVRTSDFDQFSNEALSMFLEDSKLVYSIDDDDFKTYLADIGVMSFVEEESIYKPTGMGLLLFGENPRSKYPQAGLKCYADYGEGNLEYEEFDQPLVLIPKLVEEWFKKVLPSIKDRSSVKRKEIPTYPIAPVLEVIINALVHRDYNIEGAHSNLFIDSDKIVISSPGALLPAISLSQLNKFQAPSLRRNPIITYVFSLMDLMEETGLGMRELQSLHTKHNLPLPIYQYNDPFLTLTLPRSKKAERQIVDKIEKLNNEELVGFDWIKLQGEVSKKEYADHFKFDDKKAQRHLLKMKRLNLIGTNDEHPKSPKLKYVYKDFI